MKTHHWKHLVLGLSLILFATLLLQGCGSEISSFTGKWQVIKVEEAGYPYPLSPNHQMVKSNYAYWAGFELEKDNTGILYLTADTSTIRQWKLLDDHRIDVNGTLFTWHFEHDHLILKFLVETIPNEYQGLPKNYPITITLHRVDFMPTHSAPWTP